MLIDSQTLDDLEVFRAQGGSASLFESLNRTVTKGGRDALRRRFRAPFSDGVQIVAVQEALRFITAHRDLFGRLPAEQHVMPLQRYLESNYITLGGLDGPGGSLKSFWTRFRERDLFNHALAGVRAAADIVAALAELVSAVEPRNPPSALAGFIADLRLLLADSQLQELRRHPVTRRHPTRVLRLDRLIRDRRRPEIHRLLETLHEIDALVAMADVTEERGFVFPQVENGAARVDAEGIYHPFLDAPVGNPLRVDRGGSVLFITGPNMAGKTTYLRACGTAVFLAHLGMGVPARRMRFSPFACLFAGIRTTDDLRQGTSFLLAEARRVKTIAELLAKEVEAFVLFDEVFKGTNVKDAYDACRRVVLAFASARRGVFLISSHLVELVDALQKSDRVEFHHFGAEVVNGEPRYDYRLKHGHSSQRLGITLLEREGVLILLDAIGHRSGPEQLPTATRV